MVLQIRLFAEPPIAHVTSIGPGPIVDIHVGAQIPRGWERFGAQLAFVWLILEWKENKTHAALSISKTSVLYFSNYCI